jgi:type II secretory pathway pseudopilin PulG
MRWLIDYISSHLVILNIGSTTLLAVLGTVAGVMPRRVARLEEKPIAIVGIVALFFLLGTVSLGSGIALQRQGDQKLDAQAAINLQLQKAISRNGKIDARQHAKILAAVAAHPTEAPPIVKVVVPPTQASPEVVLTPKPTPTATATPKPTFTPLVEPSVSLGFPSVAVSPAPPGAQPVTQLTANYPILATSDVVMRACYNTSVFPIGMATSGQDVLAAASKDCSATPVPILGGRTLSINYGTSVATTIFDVIAKNQAAWYFAAHFSFSSGKWRQDIFRCNFFAQGTISVCPGVGLTP